MLTKARVAQPSTRIPDRYWERDQPRGHDEHWLPTAHGQGLAISDGRPSGLQGQARKLSKCT